MPTIIDAILSPKLQKITIIGQKQKPLMKNIQKIFPLRICNFARTGILSQFHKKFKKRKLVSFGLFSIEDDFLGQSLAKCSQERL